MSTVEELIKDLEESKKSEESKGPPGWFQRQKRLEDIMGIIIIVLFIGFATMFISVFGIFRDNEAAKQATFQDLKDEVQLQNARTEALVKAIQDSNKQKPK